MLSIHEVNRDQYWSFTYDLNNIYKLVRWDMKDTEEEWVPIVKRIASFWTYEKEWKFYEGDEERCNPYAMVYLRSVEFRIDSEKV